MGRERLQPTIFAEPLNEIVKVSTVFLSGIELGKVIYESRLGIDSSDDAQSAVAVLSLYAFLRSYEAFARNINSSIGRKKRKAKISPS